MNNKIEEIVEKWWNKHNRIQKNGWKYAIGREEINELKKLINQPKKEMKK